MSINKWLETPFRWTKDYLTDKDAVDWRLINFNNNLDLKSDILNTLKKTKISKNLYNNITSKALEKILGEKILEKINSSLDSTEEEKNNFKEVLMNKNYKFYKIWNNIFYRSWIINKKTWWLAESASIKFSKNEFLNKIKEVLENSSEEGKKNNFKTNINKRLSLLDSTIFHID